VAVSLDSSTSAALDPSVTPVSLPAVDPDDVVRVLRKLRTDQADHLDLLRGFARGTSGLPYIPESSTREIRRLRENSIKNIVKLVVDSFTQNLSVVGFSAGDSTANLPAWDALWQPNQLDALQSLAHTAALRYGYSYVLTLPGDPIPVIRCVSPRRMLAVYLDPVTDPWPVYAWEEWQQWSARGQVTLGRLYDATTVRSYAAVGNNSATMTLVSVDEHDIGFVPVTRFVNDRDDDGEAVGEIEPLIPLQCAINVTEFNAAVIEQFAAFSQRWIIGWKPEKDAEELIASVRRVWHFEDEDVKVGQFAAADIAPFMARQLATMQHAAMIAQVPPQQLNGDMTNLSADALAAAEAAQQRKLTLKRESFGESWEQVLRLAADLSGQPIDADATDTEMVWRITETRSYAAVADGIAKLARAGVPVEQLVQDLPGMTQQRVDRMVTEIQKNAAQADATATLLAGISAKSAPGQVGARPTFGGDPAALDPTQHPATPATPLPAAAG
jgi:hypothetical protein